MEYKLLINNLTKEEMLDILIALRYYDLYPCGKVDVYNGLELVKTYPLANGNILNFIYEEENDNTESGTE